MLSVGWKGQVVENVKQINYVKGSGMWSLLSTNL